MDRTQIISWAVGTAARYAALALAGWLSLSATQSANLQAQIGQAVGAAVAVGISLWSSYRGRAKAHATSAAAGVVEGQDQQSPPSPKPV
jgi:hypothetical protein